MPRMPLHMRQLHVAMARVRLLQWEHAQGAQNREKARNHFLVALKHLRQAASGHPTYVAHWLLLQVSIASSKKFDPHEQAQDTLDEIIRILGAERGFLFLAESGGDDLVLWAARNVDGRSITEEKTFSNTAVRMVFSHHKPVLLSSGDDGVVLRAAESVIAHRLRSIIAAPLLIRDRFIGVVYLDSRLARGVFSEDEMEILHAISSHIAIAIENARLFEKIQHQAVTDSLTETYSRGHFFTEAGRGLQRARRYGRPVSVIMLDIDYFKKINDRYGHQVGDTTLKEVALRIRGAVREIDLVGRYGGEEFSVFMADTDEAGALVVAERIRGAVADLPVVSEKGDVSVTISAGVAWAADNHPDLSKLLGVADNALYSAKEKGRNRVEIST